MGITAVLMAVMFVSVGIQGSLPQTAQHVHEKTMVQENRYNSYLISNPVNASDQLSNMFISWISGIEHANPYVGGKVSAFHMPSQAQVKELFLFYQTLPDISENSAFIVVAGVLSETAHDISGKIGWNSLGTES